MNLVVFSRDRACQLHAFLVSFRRHVCDRGLPVALHTATTAEFEQGYERLATLIPDADLRHEGSDFKGGLLDLIDRDAEHTCFFVDDIVFRAPFGFSPNELAWLDDPDVACLSLRLSSAIDHTFTTGQQTPAPVTGAGTWRWRGHRGDWGYPMSLDGHVFRTDDIVPMLEERDYRNPNLLEAALARQPIGRPLMACPADHPIVNIPANRVQTTFENRHGDGPTAEELNRAFLAGAVIDVSRFDGLPNRSAHHPTELALVAAPD